MLCQRESPHSLQEDEYVMGDLCLPLNTDSRRLPVRSPVSSETNEDATHQPCHAIAPFTLHACVFASPSAVWIREPENLPRRDRS